MCLQYENSETVRIHFILFFPVGCGFKNVDWDICNKSFPVYKARVIRSLQ